MNLKRFIILILIAVGTYLLMGSSCSNYTNFTTYFNTYYNMERLMHESEDEFEFQDEKKRVQPRVLVPNPSIYVSEDNSMGPPAFLTEFIVNKQKRQPVQVKLDSIVIKGSKILARKGTSDYVEGALWLMAKSFFYQEDWLNSQLKCSELVDKFPAGDLSPDAHLLYTKNLLIQRKFHAGQTMLSRTVDIAWQKKRYDILSEAFRIEAELALLENDFEKALRPYKNAISQTDDGAIKARWQLDMASLLYRIHKFELAYNAFRFVHEYSPDYLQKYEAYLYQGASLARLKRYEEAEDIFTLLANDGKYEEWLPYTQVQQLQLVRMKWLDSAYITKEDEPKNISELLSQSEKTVDSAHSTNHSLLVYYFEKGMNYYEKNDYNKARSMFAKSRVTRTPVFKSSEKMFGLMNNWDIKRKGAEPLLKVYQSKDSTLSDSLRYVLADNLFALGRIHEELGNQDSVHYYFKLAVDAAPLSNPESSRFYHAYARIIRPDEPFKADSLLDILVTYHPLTEYGRDAQKQLGYTSNYVIDTVAELYTSGLNLMRHGDYNYSVNQFTKLYNEYPKSKYAPPSIYTIGWIYEKYFKIPDSAVVYYRMLLERYPESEHAKEVNLGVAYKTIVDNNEPVPDSLKERKINIPKPLEIEKIKQNMQKVKQINHRKEPPRPEDLIKNPSSILNNPEGLMENPIEMLKNAELPANPLSDPVKFFKLDESKPPIDSTNIALPDTTKPVK